MEAADYALALSIAQAVEADAALIAALLQEDEQAERDRNFAQRLEEDSDVGSPSTVNENDAQDRQLDDEAFDTLRLFNIVPPETDTVLPVADDTTTAPDDVDVDMDDVNEINDERDFQDPSPGLDHDIDQNINHDEGLAESESEELLEEAPEPESETEAEPLAEEQPFEEGEPSTDTETETEPEQVENPTENLSILATAPSPAATPPQTTECITCSDEFFIPDLFEAPCSHSICRTCLATWIQTSMRDESSFPPKCCGQIIPIAADNPLISEEQFEEYEARKVELETPDRTYCSDAACASFIPPRSIEGDIASCIRCGRETCVKCKLERHLDLCSGQQDDETQQLFAMAEGKGWRQCSQCHYMISLSLGCNHISCRCGFQFCYLCGEQWKTCDCPHLQVENLLDGQDENILRPQPPNAPGAGPVRGGPCPHINARRVPGEQECDQCHQVLRIFLMHCLRCGRNLCNRCRGH